MFYLRLLICAVIIISAAILKWSSAPVDSVIGNTINSGINYKNTVNTLGRVISGEENVLSVFKKFTDKTADTFKNTSKPADEIPKENEDKENSKNTEEDNTENTPEQDIISQDFYVKKVAAMANTSKEAQEKELLRQQEQNKNKEIENLSFLMSPEETADDTKPVPFVIPPPSNCSYQKDAINFKFSTPLFGVITSPFGYRDHPIEGNTSFHTGMDIATKKGMSVKAFAAGKVLEAGVSQVYGKYVLISHKDGFCSFYGHNSKLKVKKGQKVKLGQKIAEVGSTGLSTGPHLHFEVRKGSVRLNPKFYISPERV